MHNVQSSSRQLYLSLRQINVLLRHGVTHVKLLKKPSILHQPGHRLKKSTCYLRTTDQSKNYPRYYSLIQLLIHLYRKSKDWIILHHHQLRYGYIASLSCEDSVSRVHTSRPEQCRRRCWRLRRCFRICVFGFRLLRCTIRK